MSAKTVELLNEIASALVQSNEGQKLEPSVFDHHGKRVLLVQGVNEIYEIEVRPWGSNGGPG